MNPQKIILNGTEFEWVPAEVISVDYEAKQDRHRLYTVVCKLLNSDFSIAPTDVIQARALHANIKQIPIKGEIVFVCKAPTAFHSATDFGREYYYTPPISIQASVHHNGIPGANTVIVDPRLKVTQAQDARLGLTKKLSDRENYGQILDPTFPQRLDVFPIQPFSGDIIIEGRWGQSIRLGSTIDKRRKYQIDPTWGVGSGKAGHPITIISNGTNPNRNEKSYNQFHIESPDRDDASIWLASGQSVRFTPASTYAKSIYDKQIGLFKKNMYAGNQVIIASDRIVLNARKQEIVGFSKEGIGFSTEKTLALNAKNIVEIESGRILLGFNATHPIVLGDRMMQFLKELMDLLIDMNTSITNMTHPTGVGPSGTPINSGDYVIYKNNLNKLRNRIPKLASKFAFVNEFSGGANPEERSKFDELKKNKFVFSPDPVQGGDKPNTVSFDNTQITNDYTDSEHTR